MSSRDKLIDLLRKIDLPIKLQCSWIHHREDPVSDDQVFEAAWCTLYRMRKELHDRADHVRRIRDVVATSVIHVIGSSDD